MNFIALESARKLRGGYYTPEAVARFLCRWAGEISPRRVLEPACGDGVFLRALPRARFVAYEIDPAEAARARRPGAEVRARDFLAAALEEPETEAPFDAAVGNPPYIRYQYLSEGAQRRAAAVFERAGLAFTRHTNAWVPFVIASLALLRPGGRLAMVVPAELLHVLHAGELRRHLGESCSRVRIVDPRGLLFEGALQGTLLLMAEKGLGPARIAIRRAERFEASADELFAGAPEAAASGSRKWTAALLGERERAAFESAAAALPRFADLAEVDVGVVTGANRFFLVDDATVRAHGLRRFARPAFGRSAHARGVIYDQGQHDANIARGLPTSLLWFDGALSAPVRRYLARGEAQGLHRRFKCRVREPWYRVPSVWASPVSMLKRSHDHPRLVWNTMGALTTDTAYRVKPRAASAAQIVFAFLNSATALSAEIEGRHYGGGVLELVPSEIEKLLVPRGPERPPIEELDRRVRAGTPAPELLRAQDELLLRALPRSERLTLLEAWLELRARRQRSA